MGIISLQRDKLPLIQRYREFPLIQLYGELHLPLRSIRGDVYQERPFSARMGNLFTNTGRMNLWNITVWPQILNPKLHLYLTKDNKETKLC